MQNPVSKVQQTWEEELDIKFKNVTSDSLLKQYKISKSLL